VSPDAHDEGFIVVTTLHPSPLESPRLFRPFWPLSQLLRCRIAGVVKS